MIKEIRGRDHVGLLRSLNGLEPSFPELTEKHVNEGYWWVAYVNEDEPIGFAGLVEMIPFSKTGYMKRAFVKPEFRGRGLQGEFLALRCLRAQKLGWTTLVSECSKDNLHSAANFKRAGFRLCEPEQKWARPNDFYWVKHL